MKYTKSLILLFLSIFLFATLASCTSKEERCDQVATALLRYGVIKNKAYHNKGIQKICIKEWATEGNEEWRDCILDAGSLQGLIKNKCKKMPHEKGSKFKTGYE